MLRCPGDRRPLIEIIVAPAQVTQEAMAVAYNVRTLPALEVPHPARVPANQWPKRAQMYYLPSP
jgi:hypothetical protein